jgi:lysophospholipase L1-like esterase
MNRTLPSGSAHAIPSPTAALPAAMIPPGPLTIAALGDSLTEGQGGDAGAGGYPGRLAALIEPVRPGTHIDNFGHSGWSSSDVVDGQNGEPSELTQATSANPNVALVWIGSNDLWYLYEFGPEPMTAEAEQADLAAYEANVDAILRGLTSHGAVVLIALLDDQSKRPVVADPPNPAEPAFPGTTAADLARMSAHVRAYNDIIGRKAAQYGASTVDFFDATIFTDRATLSGDGNHPNSAGYDRVAQLWFAALQPALN